MIEFLSEEESAGVDREYILNMLPRRRTKILEVTAQNAVLSLRLCTDCKTVEEVQSWIAEFEEATATTYSIRSTKTTAGWRVNFKQILNCQHNNHTTTKLYDISGQNRTKNTNCPATMTITLHAIKKRFRGKDKEKRALLKEMSCEISLILTHNHSIGNADALRFRKVSSGVQERLINLFRNGHSVATAIETLKTEIYLNYDNYETILADRNHCPDYNYCYRLYMKEFKGKYGPLDFDGSGKELLPLYDKNRQDITSDINNITNNTITNIMDISDENFIEEGNAESEEQFKENGKVAVEKLTKLFLSYLEKSPREIATALEKMTEHTEKLRTTSAFGSACSTFAIDYHRKKARVGGRPRKTALRGVQKKKMPHALSRVLKARYNKHLNVNNNESQVN